MTDQFGIDNKSTLEEDAASAEFLGGGACWGTVQMQALVPIDNLMEKLEDDVRKQKEKAEKNAKNLVQSAIRKKQSKDSRDDKKK